MPRASHLFGSLGPMRGKRRTGVSPQKERDKGSIVMEQREAATMISEQHGSHYVAPTEVPGSARQLEEERAPREGPSAGDVG